MRDEESYYSLYPDTVLDKPFVDCLGWMGHEDSASKIGLSQNKRQAHSMVKVKTSVDAMVSLCRRDWRVDH